MLILYSFFFLSSSFLLFHFPTATCNRFFSVKTCAIDLELRQDVQNGLSSHSNISGNVTYGQNIGDLRNFSQRSCQLKTWRRPPRSNCCDVTRRNAAGCNYRHQSRAINGAIFVVLISPRAIICDSRAVIYRRHRRRHR